MNGIDTNVLLYAHEPVKRSKATALLARLHQTGASVVLPWQVIGEYLAGLPRWENFGRLSSTDVESNVSRLIAGYAVAFPTIDLVSRAIDLHRRHSLSHWDSMLLAACVEAGVTTLYSEDLQDGAVYETVTVVDPFA